MWDHIPKDEAAFMAGVWAIENARARKRERDDLRRMAKPAPFNVNVNVQVVTEPSTNGFKDTVAKQIAQEVEKLALPPRLLKDERGTKTEEPPPEAVAFKVHEQCHLRLADDYLVKVPKGGFVAMMPGTDLRVWVRGTKDTHAWRRMKRKFADADRKNTAFVDVSKVFGTRLDRVPFHPQPSHPSPNDEIYQIKKLYRIDVAGERYQQTVYTGDHVAIGREPNDLRLWVKVGPKGWVPCGRFQTLRRKVDFQADMADFDTAKRVYTYPI